MQRFNFPTEIATESMADLWVVFVSAMGGSPSSLIQISCNVISAAACSHRLRPSSGTAHVGRAPPVVFRLSIAFVLEVCMPPVKCA
jgi:hypothetical protein